MKNLTIALASGKGGTGKTTISVNLAYSLMDKYKYLNLIDCDVEEPNSRLFFKNLSETENLTVGIKIPEINDDKCTYCGKCAEVCEFGAIAVIKQIEKTFVSPDLCHGCGACSYFCPENAITEVQKDLGIITKYTYKNLNLIEGKLNLHETVSTPVLRETLKNIDNNTINILDAPPGTSCSMVTTIEKADFVILVTEPTPFGVNDLKLALELVREMKKPHGIVINKANFGNDEIYKLIKEKHINLLMELPFKKEFAKAYSDGKLITEEFPDYKNNFINIVKKIEDILYNSKENYITNEERK